MSFNPFDFTKSIKSERIIMSISARVSASAEALCGINTNRSSGSLFATFLNLLRVSSSKGSFSYTSKARFYFCFHLIRAIVANLRFSEFRLLPCLPKSEYGFISFSRSLFMLCFVVSTSGM